MADNSFYTSIGGGPDNPNTKRANALVGGQKLPVISTELDSVRSYQWEVQFDISDIEPLGAVEGGPAAMNSNTLTLACKQITGLSYAFKDIEVHRMNDLVYYPGKVTHEEVTMTFDNLLQDSPGRQFYEYLATVFDMRTGFYPNNTSGRSYKRTLKIFEFDGAGNMVNVIELKGAYPKSFTKGEKNYAQSEFDTFEVKFRYDFMNLRGPLPI
jgi:hypothetical protein